VIHIGTILALRYATYRPQTSRIDEEFSHFRFGARSAIQAAMDSLLVSAASGMKARMESLDMLANNIANTGTAGFKSDREFYGLYQDEFPVIEKQWTDFSQGTLNTTGNPLNLGLSGKGFFALNGANGTVYTRNGDFKIAKSGELQASDVYTLRNVLDQGKPIKVDPSLSVDIDKDGIVRQSGQQLGQIEISTLDTAADAISKLGNSYFALAGKTAAPRAQDVEVKQGTLEQSNVAVSESAVRLVSVMRSFEMLQRALSIGADMNKHVIEEVARVS
jgi:flagellar basal body rod protein FlgG